MSKAATRILGALLFTCLAALPALAAQYPPTCPDSITIWNVQNPAASCHPTNGDTTWVGLHGIVTGLDTKPSGVGFWLQLQAGGPWSGIDVFTGNTGWPLAIGDSVIVRPSMVMEYGGETEVVSLTGSFGTNLYVTKIASNRALPPFQSGNAAYWNTSPLNPTAEQWEGCLVKLTGPVRVARVTGVGTNNYMVVDSACTVGPCDSVFVDGTTIPNPSLGQPALGTVLQWIRGIVGQTANGYRIRMRDDNDWYPSVNPPSVADAYPVHDDTIRVIFDKAVVQSSAESTSNYTLGSFGSVNSATLEASGSIVDLYITNGLGHGVQETVNVSGVRAVANGKAMQSTQSRTFWNGVNPISVVQAPDPTYLAGSPCLDRSIFAGTGSAPGLRMTYRGVCTAVFPEALNYLQDNSAATRSGVATYATVAPLTVGHQYLVVASIQEYYEETESTNNVYLRDEGPATLPSPVVQTVAVLRDTSCDASQAYLSGEDYEGMVVKLSYVKSVQHAGAPGYGFDVAGPNPAFTDTIHIRNVRATTPWTYQADSMMVLDVTGIQTFSFGTMQVAPRTNADFLDHGLNVGVPAENTPAKVAFAVYPNPARTATVSFALPRQDDVDLAVFDLTGRRVATLAKGSLPAGKYTREWTGSGVGAGVYFVRLRVGTETYNLRAVRLK